jgi:hypothetical protein
MFDSEKGEIPPPHFALVVMSIFALAFVLFLPGPERARFLGIVRKVAGMFDGEPETWPLNFRRKHNEAPLLIRQLRLGCNWVRHFTDQLEVIARTI